jgi:hypothetical protein
MHPVNDAERDMSEKIRQMVIDVADALISSDPLSKNMDMLGEGWLTISSVYSCLVLLGEDVPSSLVDRLRKLILDCKKFADKNREIGQLELTFKHRFG